MSSCMRSRLDPTLSDFNQLIWWMVLLKVGIVFVFLLLTTIFMIWFERRVIGRMQNRPGPNRAGPLGLLQPIADALKLPLKEDIVPTGVDKLVFVVAPVIAAAPAFVSLRDHPVGPGGLDLPPPDSAAGHRPAGGGAARAGDELDRRLRHRAGGLGVRSPYSLLGALRSTAQVISYEIAMGLSFVAVFLYAGSLSTSRSSPRSSTSGTSGCCSRRSSFTS